MPPRLPSRTLRPTTRSTSTTISSFLIPFLQQQSPRVQTRSASILSSLRDTAGSYSKRIRRGRGPSSGKGKTSGRGHKGQKQHGKVPKGFQGGQTLEGVVHGKFGQKNIHGTEMSPVNLSRIASWIAQRRLDPSKPITLKELTSSRAIHGIKDGVKLLAEGASDLITPVHLIVSRASQSAIAAVEAAGGTVTTRYYTAQAIARIRQGVMHPYISLRWDPIALKNNSSNNNNKSAAAVDVSSNVYSIDNEGMTPEERVTGLGYQYRLPDPASRKEIEYYRDERNRGYLSHTVKEGESASLYFRPPPSEEEIQAARKAARSSARGGDAQKREANKLW